MRKKNEDLDIDIFKSSQIYDDGVIVVDDDDDANGLCVL